MRISLLFLFLVFCGSLFSQDLLLLEKTEGVKRFRYIKGSETTFTYVKTNPKNQTEERIYVEGVIEKFDADTVQVSGLRIAYSDIAQWWKPYEKRRLPDFAMRGFRTAGRLYFLISAFNGLVNNDSPIIHPSASIALGAGEALGLFFKNVPRRYYNLQKGKWQLRAVDFGTATEPQE